LFLIFTWACRLKRQKKKHENPPHAFLSHKKSTGYLPHL
jgi:hypothetical protein